VSRRIEELARLILVQRVSVSTNHYISCYKLNSVNYGAVVIRGGKPDSRRPEAKASAFSYDAVDVLSLD